MWNQFGGIDKAIRNLNECRKTHKAVSKKRPTKGQHKGGAKDNKFIKVGGVRIF